MNEDPRPLERVADHLERYRDASEEEKQYQLERAVRYYCADMGKEEKENMLLLVDIVFTGWAKEMVHAALREDAHYPENCVGSAKEPKLLNPGS